MELLPAAIALVVVAIVVRDCVKVFASTKYGGRRELDTMQEEIKLLQSKLKKYEDEKILDKVRSLDNRFGRL